MPELAPVTIAFWALSNLRFSVLGTTGFGRSPKVCACGIFGFGRLIASGGMVGIVIPFFVLQIRRDELRFLTKLCGFGVRRCSAAFAAFSASHRKDFAYRVASWRCRKS